MRGLLFYDISGKASVPEIGVHLNNHYSDGLQVEAQYYYKIRILLVSLWFYVKLFVEQLYGLVPFHGVSRYISEYFQLLFENLQQG